MQKRINTSQSQKQRQKRKQEQQSHLITQCQYTDMDGFKESQNQDLFDDIYANLHDPEDGNYELYNDLMGPWNINENQKSETPSSFLLDKYSMIKLNTHPAQDSIGQFDETTNRNVKLVKLPRPISHNMIKRKKQLTPTSYWYKNTPRQNNKGPRGRTQTTQKKQLNLQQPENILNSLINIQNINVVSQEQQQNDIERIINQYFKSNQKQQVNPIVQNQETQIQMFTHQPQFQFIKKTNQIQVVDSDPIPLNKLLFKLDSPSFSSKKAVLQYKGVQGGPKEYFKTLPCKYQQTSQQNNACQINFNFKCQKQNFILKNQNIQTEGQGLMQKILLERFKQSPYNQQRILKMSSHEVSPSKKFSFTQTQKTKTVASNFDQDKNGDDQKYSGKQQLNFVNLPSQKIIQLLPGLNQRLPNYPFRPGVSTKPL